MDLGSEIRNSIIMSAMGGFLIGISWFVSGIILTILPTDSISLDTFAQLVGFVVFLIGVFIIVEAWRKKPSIVADVEMVLDIARKQAKAQTSVGQTEKGKRQFYCRYCGMENKLDASFCEACGARALNDLTQLYILSMLLQIVYLFQKKQNKKCVYG